MNKTAEVIDYYSQLIEQPSDIAVQKKKKPAYKKKMFTSKRSSMKKQRPEHL